MGCLKDNFIFLFVGMSSMLRQKAGIAKLYAYYFHHATGQNCAVIGLSMGEDMLLTKLQDLVSVYILCYIMLIVSQTS